MATNKWSGWDATGFLGPSDKIPVLLPGEVIADRNQVILASNLADNLAFNNPEFGGDSFSLVNTTRAALWETPTANALPNQLSGHSAVAYKRKLWILGGLNDTADATTSAVYSSTDGITWEAGTVLPTSSTRDGAACVYKNRVFFFGGHNGTGSPAASTRSQGVYSFDGSSWTLLSSNLPAGCTVGLTATVFLDKIWIIGGWDGTSYNSTIYSTFDGITFTNEGSFPTGVQGAAAAVYNGYLWVVGGNDGVGDGQKVYRSADGTTWAEVGTDALPVPVSGATLNVLNGQLVLIGGDDSLGTAEQDTVNVSVNGSAWTEVNGSATGEAVAYHTTTLFNGRLYRIGGKFGSDSSNDVYTCDVSLQGPAVIRTFPGQTENAYTVENSSGTPISQIVAGGQVGASDGNLTHKTFHPISNPTLGLDYSGTTSTWWADAFHLQDSSANDLVLDISGISGARTITFPARNIDLSAGGTFAELSHTHAASDITSGTFDNARIAVGNVTQHVASIDHDSTLNFVADEHVAHSGVTLTAGSGLSGGGTIAASRTFNLDLSDLTTETTIAGTDLLAFHDTGVGPKNISWANLQAGISITESQISDLGAYITASSVDTLTNKTISALSNTITNIGASSVIANLVDGQSEDATPAAGDFLLGTSGGALAKFDVGKLVVNLPVDDTTALVQDPIDNTRRVRIDAGGVATLTTRTIFVPDRDIDLAEFGTFAEASHEHTTLEITSGTFLDARISQSSVTQHEAAINHDNLLGFVANEHIDHSAVTLTAGVGLSGGGTIAASRTFDLDIDGLTLGGAIIGTDTIAYYDAGVGVRKIAVSSLLAVSHSHAASDITSGTFADARIAESNVTQHQAALSITESQISDLGTYQVTSEKGVANGYASLDSGGKVPTAQLPASVLGDVSYQGTWNATTNSPALASSTGTKGYYYKVSVAGSTNLDGITDWQIGDWAIFNGGTWDKVDNTDQVSTVFGRTGAIVATSGDYTSTLITNSSSVVGATVTAALNQLDSDITALNHDTLPGFVADEHVAHSGVTLTAGSGLSGGGTIAASRTFDLDLNDLTTETSIAGADLVPFHDSGVGPKNISWTNLQLGISITESQISDYNPAATNMARVAGSTYSTIQHMQDIFHSTGVTTGGGITDDTDGTITVAAGSGLIRATDSDVAQILWTDWPAESGANVALTDTSMNYVYVEYNAGSPRIVATAIQRTDTNTNILLGTVYRNGTTLHITERTKPQVGDHALRMIQRLNAISPFARASGGIISETGTRNIAVSAGTWWEGLNEFTTPARDTSVADTFIYYYRDGVGGWTAVTAQTQINNTQYDDGSGTLATLTDTQYGVHWVYLDVEGELFVLYGQGDYTINAAADADAPATTPPHFAASHARLIGKITILKNAASFTATQSVFDTVLNTGTAADHGGLVGLGDDDHSQYSLITSGGGAPATTPARVGAVYVDTTGDRFYGATGDASSADWDIFVTPSSTDTLTNKTINGDNNTITNLAHGAEVDNPTSGVHGVTGNVVGTTDSQTLTNKTLGAGTVITAATMTLGTDGTGDIYYRDAGGALTRLGIGSASQVLTVSGGLPSWQNSATGVTDHGALTGILDDDHTQYSIISSGAGAPASTPARVGAVYVDTTADRFYISTDTLGSGDWDIAVTPSSTDTITNKTIDGNNNTISNLVHGAEVDNPTSGVHGVTGSVVGTSDAQVLTNKTIDGNNNTISNLAHGAEVDNPTSGVHGVTGSVVGTTDSQTLTNKTLGSGTVITAATMTLGTDATGDIYYRNAGGALTRLPIGTASQVLTVSGGLPAWAAAAGGGGGDAITEDITQATHGFAVGDVLKYTGGAYAKAQADTAANAEVVGVVSAVAGANDFTITYSGRVTGLSGLTANTLYYLDPSSAGALTATEPTTVGDINKPILFATSTTSGIVQNLRGVQIAGSGVVQPYEYSWIPASYMIPRTTNGADPTTVELTGQDIMVDALAFDTATEEGVGFWVNFTDKWNAGTVKVKFYWTATVGSGNVKWDIAGQSYADSDVIDQTLGTEQGVIDTLLTTSDMHITDATAEITVADATAGEPVYFQITRDIGTASDIGTDVLLIGCMIQYRLNSTPTSAW